MTVIQNLKYGKEVSYKKSNGELVIYTVVSIQQERVVDKDTVIHYVIAKNTAANVVADERMAIFVEYEQLNQSQFVRFQRFQLIHNNQALDRNTRLFVLNRTAANLQFYMPTKGRWHFLVAENLQQQILYPPVSDPAIKFIPGFYTPDRLILPASPVIPVILPRPNLQPQATVQQAERFTKTGKLTLEQYRGLLNSFITEEKWQQYGIMPRPHQKNDLIKTARGAENCRHTQYALVNPAPTGYGKTIFSAMLFAALRARTLFIVPSNVLLNQTIIEYRKMFPNANVIAYESKDSFETVVANNDLIVTTIQMLQYDGRYIDRFYQAMSQVGFVIFDEVHNCISDTRNHIVQTFKNAQCHVLGLTATPCAEVYNAFGYYGDGRDNPIPKLTLVETIDLKIVPAVSINVVDCPALYQNQSDDDDMALDVLPENDDSIKIVIQLIADVFFNGADQLTNEFYYYMKTMIFMARKKDATALAEKINQVYKNNQNNPKIKNNCDVYDPSHGYQFAEAVHSDQPNAKDIIEAFRKGYCRVLIGVKMIVEGFDVPDVEAIFVPSTDSSNLLMQAAGRGLRTPANSMYMTASGELVNSKVTHFVNIFWGSLKKVKYFHNQLTYKKDGKTIIQFSHGIDEDRINGLALPNYPKIATGLDAQYTLRIKPNQQDLSAFQKMERLELHTIAGITCARQQYEKIPENVRNILEQLDEQFQILQIQLKSFENVEVHTEHIYKRKVLEESSANADNSSKRVAVQSVDENERPERIAIVAKSAIMNTLDELTTRFTEINQESGKKSAKAKRKADDDDESPKKNFDLNDLIVQMLSQCKHMSARLEMFSNEMMLKNSSEGFKNNVDRFVKIAEELVKQQTEEKVEKKAEKKVESKVGKIEDVIPKFVQPRNLVGVAYTRVSIEKGLEHFIKMFPVKHLENDYAIAAVVSYALNKNYPRNVEKTLTTAIVELINRITGFLSERATLILANTRGKKKLTQKETSAIRAVKQIDKDIYTLVDCFSVGIQYLQINQTIARNLLVVFRDAKIFDRRPLDKAIAALVCAGKYSLEESCPDLISQHINRELDTATTSIAEALKAAYKYGLFYELEKLFFYAVQNQMVHDVSEQSQWNYLNKIIVFTNKVISAAQFVTQYYAGNSSVINKLCETILIAHAKKEADSAFYVSSVQWHELLPVINKVLHFKLTSPLTNIPNLHQNNPISVNELLEDTNSERGHQWLLLPQLATILSTQPQLGDKLNSFCKQRVLLLYLHMRDKELMTPQLQQSFFNQLRNRKEKISFIANRYESMFMKKLFETYHEIDSECPVDEVMKLYDDFIISELSEPNANMGALRILIDLVLKQVDRGWRLHNQYSTTGIKVICRMIYYSFRFADELESVSNEFIQQQYVKLIDLISVEPIYLGSNTVTQFFTENSIFLPKTTMIANQLFALLYVKVKQAMDLNRQSHFISIYILSEENKSGSRLFELQKSLSFFPPEMLFLYLHHWSANLAPSAKVDYAPMHSLLSAYEQHQGKTSLFFANSKSTKQMTETMYIHKCKYLTPFSESLTVDITFETDEFRLPQLQISNLFAMLLCKQLVFELIKIIGSRSKSESMRLAHCDDLIDNLHRYLLPAMSVEQIGELKLLILAVINCTDTQDATKKLIDGITKLYGISVAVFLKNGVTMKPSLNVKYPEIGGRRSYMSAAYVKYEDLLNGNATPLLSRLFLLSYPLTEANQPEHIDNQLSLI